MHTTLLDTGPIIAWLRARDPDHRPSAGAIADRARRGRLATIWEVVGEAYTVMRRRADARSALRVLDWANTVDRLPVEPSDRDRCQELLRRHPDLRLSYVDALLLAVAERLRARELLTLDAELSAVRLRSGLLVTVL